MSSYSREQLEVTLSQILVEDCKVLDIGGSQLPISNRVIKKGNNTFKIMDLAVPHETKILPDYIGDIQSIQDCEKLQIKDSFNIAFCIEVSEYWYDPLTALKNINSSLFKNGYLIISFHFLYPIHKPQGKDYLRYTRYGAIRLLEEAGFKIYKYTPRYVRHKGTMWAFYRSEGYKHDKGESEDILTETGCVIIAQKI